MKRYLIPAALTLGSLLLIGLSFFKVAPISMIEVFGFVTGAACVYLAAKNNIWSWPIGIANAGFFTALFYSSKLFADMSLQVVYIVLGFLGWYMWLRGGQNKTQLPITGVPKDQILLLVVIGGVATYFMTNYLESIGDSAPFLDALTTVMSLIAQYMLTRRYVENWYVWLSVDVIYVYLYASKELFLTAILYTIFFAMCAMAVKEWRAKKVIEPTVLAERGQSV